MRLFFLLPLAALLYACAPSSEKADMNRIDAEEAAGNFAAASRLIDLYAAEHPLSPAETYDLYVRKERMNRIRKNFNKDQAAVIRYIQPYYPEVDARMLEKWEQAKTLEAMQIDGEKRYFDRAAPNLFRLDPDAIARKTAINPPVDDKEKVLRTHLPAVVNTLNRSGKTQANPVPMQVKYSLTLQANAVPEGETIRCWLPYPREDNRRQSGVQLLSVNDSNYLISPPHVPHRSIYMEKVTRKDEPLTFAFEFSYRHAPEWFNLNGKALPPANLDSDEYRIYTAEQPPHILFSDSIRAISERILGDETNPYQKVRKLWAWIDQSFPWAGAREYSTLSNIPEYVLEHRKGDCGQVTLLFIALARYNGIPARWQSGFMMHPESVNMHDWSEYYIDGFGWIPMDESFGINRFADDNDDVKYFYSNGIDAYRWIVNNDFSQPLYPHKIFLRSDDVDFQRGELEWRGGNIYYDQWSWDIEVHY